MTHRNNSLVRINQVVENQLLDLGIKPLRNGVASGDIRAPVLRNSIEQGTFENGWWHRPKDHDPDTIFKSAKRYTINGRNQRRAYDPESGEAPARPLTAGALDILEWLCMMARLCNGRLFPSYDAIIEATGRCRQTIARALTQLESIGILQRQRRCKRNAKKGEGPRFVQTSNVYRLSLPKWLEAFKPAKKAKPPTPVDYVERLKAEEAEQSLWAWSEPKPRKDSPTSQPSGYVSPELLAFAAKIGALPADPATSPNSREYDNHTQPPLKDIYNDLAGDDKLPVNHDVLNVPQRPRE
ncbi:helix-turn-helix domain-containing protein [Alterisphingorhabdus coralli]|uniref:Helix-turn-helix domain-containing protein n=1 Tax=Alterisphingorhabdus coralli TaxID=3071408 RepID=A0AA97FBH1_9SPHN|nr:helix-turn-helix domain-containing protein [Parasphingorhabdus sp. SCSIO 66989]WOE76733.1 helix-turn-helix domain-containing protein [Parasphingorhabdus sp. SCSIO 66989]